MLSLELKAIKRVANQPNVSIPYLKEKLDTIFKRYHHSPVEISPHQSMGKFHRSRSMREKPTHIGELNYPPSPEKVILQRANHAKKPVFYCSGNPRATLFEIGLQSETTIVLSKWVLIKSILVSLLGYTQETFFALGANRRCPDIFPAINKQHNEYSRSNIRITEFLANEFTVPEKTSYKLTATIAEMFLETRNEYGIAYPAIGMHANAENFAFTKELVDNSLKIVSAKWFIVSSSNSLIAIDYADSFSTSGNIIWKGYVPAEEQKYL
ncbi:MAG: hypothetical protein A3F46_04270 [Legionellales bacterium RIFCSPHIGHO2_12_FULL_42_9]|nr:MAG: hypothetical protein A3F46_04270 [Legionellales bacterium RIFCSPHIGHO2_12_FULL_42_9]